MIGRVAHRWNAFWFAPSPASTLGTCRLLFFGALFLWQLPHDFSAWGTYSRVFWMPIWLFDAFGLAPLSPQALAWVQIVWKLALLLSAVGVFTRWAMFVSLALGTYLMGLPHNFGQTQHFDTLVVFAMAALAVSRAGDACSIDALRRAAAARTCDPPVDSGEYTWPVRFVWVATALAFGAAGFAKMRHSGLEWVFSDNFPLLLLRQQYHLSDGEPLTTWGIWVANHRVVAQAMAAAAVGTELLFPLAIFSGRARAVLVPAGLAFLVGIRLLMGPTFEQFMICYVFWVPWSRVRAFVRATAAGASEQLVLFDGGCGLCSRAVVVLSRLDVLGRLRYADISREWPEIAAAFPTLDADACLGEMHVVASPFDARRRRIEAGFDAYRLLARVVPLGWLALPFLYLPGVDRVGRRIYRQIALHRATVTCALPVR